MIKFLHAADLHLDAAFGDLSPAEASQRRQEQRQQLTHIAALANEQNCDLVLLSGDIFDGEAVFPETTESLCRALAAIRGQVFISPGNHDYFTQNSPYFTDKFPENVHIFTSSTISAVPVPQLGCTVYGAAFTAMSMPAMLEGFRAEGNSIMVLHGETDKPGSDYNPITKAQIADSNLSYLALGHVHQHGALRCGETLCAWPGCSMGRGFDELGEKGVILGKLDETGCEIRFCPLPGRRYEILRVAAGNDALAAAEAALPENTADDLYRIIFTGEADALDLATLENSLKSRFYSLQLRDETTPKLDIWQGVGDDTLRGQFLAMLQGKLNSASAEEKAVIELAARLGIYAMEGREEVLEW